MKKIVKVENNDLVVSIQDMADFSKNDYESVRKLIKDNKTHFEDLGVIFRKDSRDRVDFKSTEMNEPQATFLITLMRNNEVVTEFKKSLVTQFFKMRNNLLERKDYQIKKLKEHTYAKPKTGDFQFVDRIRQNYNIQATTHELNELLVDRGILNEEQVSVSNFLPNTDSNYAIRQGNTTLVYERELLDLVDELEIGRGLGYEDHAPRLDI